MAEHTGIEWADATWNPVRGCTKVSPGCANCYAEKLSKRNPGTLGVWGPNGTRVVAVEKTWGDPVRWARRHLRAVERGDVESGPLRIFTASLGDVFESHPIVAEVRKRIWRETLPALDAIRLPDGRPAAVLLLLTKRARIARDWYDAHGCPNTVWPGVTVEDQQLADERIPIMLGLPRLWLSVEPMLGPVDLEYIAVQYDGEPGCLNPLSGVWWPAIGDLDQEYRERRDWLTGSALTAREYNGDTRISWIICGGESGPGARPMHPAWARSLRDQCVAAGVPFFFKQWGEWGPDFEGDGRCNVCQERKHDMVRPDGTCAECGSNSWRPARWDEIREVVRIGKKAAGRLLDGQEWSEVPRG